MRHLTTIAILATALVAYSAEPGDVAPGEVVIGRYKLSAMMALGARAVYEYEREPNPNRQCVMMTLSAEFTGDFVFFAQTVDPNNLEIVCFTPRSDGKKEWAGRFIKYDDKTKAQFQKLHKILSEDALQPKEREEGYLPIMGENKLAFQVGAGPKVSWGELSAGYIAKNPARSKRLLECLQIAESLADIALPKELE